VSMNKLMGLQKVESRPSMDRKSTKNRSASCSECKFCVRLKLILSVQHVDWYLLYLWVPKFSE